MLSKKNAPLIIGFLIPILMVLFVAASIYLPGLFLQPKYNFLYSTGGDYYGSRSYFVSNGHLAESPQPTPYPNYKPSPSPQLYIHDVTTNMSTSISFQDAAALTLDPSAESPDKYRLEDGINSGGIFPFFWYDRDNNSKYLVGHNVSKKLNVNSGGSSYYDAIHFLGWVIQ